MTNWNLELVRSLSEDTDSPCYLLRDDFKEALASEFEKRNVGLTVRETEEEVSKAIKADARIAHVNVQEARDARGEKKNSSVSRPLPPPAVWAVVTASERLLFANGGSLPPKAVLDERMKPKEVLTLIEKSNRRLENKPQAKLEQYNNKHLKKSS